MPEKLTDPDDIRRYSNALRLQSERRIEALTQQMTSGEIDLVTWQDSMKAELRRANLEQFVIGKGGDRKLIDRREYLKLGPELKRQYRYLNNFAKTIEQRAADGKSIDFAVERAKLYARSTQAMMWRSAIPVKLPQVPRDGQTACRTNCKCRLRYEYERNDTGAVVAVLVYWLLRPAEHCTDCIQLSREWNPKRFEIPVEESDFTFAPIEQSVELLILAEHLYADADIIRAMWGISSYEGATCRID